MWMENGPNSEITKFFKIIKYKRTWNAVGLLCDSDIVRNSGDNTFPT